MSSSSDTVLATERYGEWPFYCGHPGDARFACMGTCAAGRLEYPCGRTMCEFCATVGRGYCCECRATHARALNGTAFPLRSVATAAPAFSVPGMQSCALAPDAAPTLRKRVLTAQ